MASNYSCFWLHAQRHVYCSMASPKTTHQRKNSSYCLSSYLINFIRSSERLGITALAIVLTETICAAMLRKVNKFPIICVFQRCCGCWFYANDYWRVMNRVLCWCNVIKLNPVLPEVHVNSYLCEFQREENPRKANVRVTLGEVCRVASLTYK